MTAMNADLNSYNFKMQKPTVSNITLFLNQTLRVKKIKDASMNGLQVRPHGTGKIETVGFAVDACLSTFEKAKRLDVELLVVHHGIKWRPQKDRDLEKQRSAYLERNGMALYAAHLPLDLHEEYGNNAQLARLLDLRRLRKFGRYHGVKIGYEGEFAKAAALADLEPVLNKQLQTRCRMLRYGKDRIRSMGIISGGGGGMLKDAVNRNLDCFLVGDIDLAVHNAARDYGMNVIVAGHYRTETAGVKALMPLVRETFGVKTIFIEDAKDW
jgi:dinuclear metal center YbgI/SA1388 family protein